MASHSGLPDLPDHVAFCRRAEACGIESLLIAFGFAKPDPIGYSVALGQHTDKIKFLVATRSSVCAPTYLVQQINTLSALTGGRVCVNIVAGRLLHEQRYYGDFLSHDERYQRTDEFWSICHALWRDAGPVSFTGRYYRIEEARLNTPFVSEDSTRPEIYVGGNSDAAFALAMRHADCLLTLPDTPARMAARMRPLLDTGTDVGLLVSMICRPSRAEAIDAANALVAAAGEQARELHGSMRDRTDSPRASRAGPAGICGPERCPTSARRASRWSGRRTTSSRLSPSTRRSE